MLHVKFLILFLVANLISCTNNHKEGNKSMSADETIHRELLQIQNKKIFFGHQSVGTNIINSMKEIASDYRDVKINWATIDNKSPEAEYYFSDAFIGQNTQPDSKCDAFAEKIDKTFSGKIDIALMKFCYVDIDAGTNVDIVFKKYQTTIETLRNKFPQIMFIHTTVPLNAKPTGIKQFIKSLIGYSSNYELENIKRNIFNSLLIEHYKTEPIFDLAGIESTYSDGTRETFSNNGKLYYSLISEYTDDGGHLNAKGGRIAAENLIHILASAKADPVDK